ncbi:MAG: plastocyanin/azurin family copper-binding protein [bacterium]
MKRLIIMFGILLVGCGGGDAAPTGTTTTPGALDVFTPGNIFSPFSLTVPVGGSVNFNISGSPEGHNVIFKKTVPGAPNDVNILITAKVSRTFNTKGTFAYDCTVHPGMTGEVVVQ